MPRPPQLRIAEASFQQAVIELARYSGWSHIFHAYDSRKSVGSGFPDLVLARHPRVLLVELKAEGGRFSPKQLDWLDELSQCPGVEVAVWRPSDWPLIQQTLAQEWAAPAGQVTG